MTDKLEILTQLLDEEGSKFPAQVDVICGKTLAKTSKWWKALLLVKTKYGKKERIQLRLYGWRWDEKNNKYKQQQKFNISRSGYLVDILFYLQAFIEESLIKGKEKSVSQKLLNKIYSLESELDKQRLIAQKNRIPEMELQIKQFERLLKKKKRKEKEIQQFLYNHFWMFGSQYKSVKKEQKAGMKGRNDFLIKKEADYYDVIELKKPEHLLFTKGKKPTIHSDLKNAISQMAQYLDYYYKHYLSYKDQTQMDVLYSKGIIVIGRRNERDRKLLKIYELIWGNRIEIWTYDDILDRGKQSLKNIKKRKK